MAHHYEILEQLFRGVGATVETVGGKEVASKGRKSSLKAAAKPGGVITLPSKPAKKSRKLPTTPRSRVRSALRQVWLRSREHQACLKAAGRACERCHVKASVAKGREVKLQVHHRAGITNWEKVIDLVFAELLVSPEMLEAVCEGCHHEEHGK